MMKIQELADLVSDGLKPVVEFKKGIEDIESYAESGMRARLVGVSSNKHEKELVDLKVDYSEFDPFNQKFEKANYYDKNGLATLTARQAGYYESTDSFCFELKEDSNRYFEVVESDSLRLYDRYKTAGESVSYVQWLETIASHVIK
jgi:hypothetical protein